MGSHEVYSIKPPVTEAYRTRPLTRITLVAAPLLEAVTLPENVVARVEEAKRIQTR